MSHFVCVCHEVGKGQHGKKNKESTWSTCCELLSELVSLLQLVKPPLIYVLRGHDTPFHCRLYNAVYFIPSKQVPFLLALYNASINVISSEKQFP